LGKPNGSGRVERNTAPAVKANPNAPEKMPLRKVQIRPYRGPGLSDQGVCRETPIERGPFNQKIMGHTPKQINEKQR